MFKTCCAVFALLVVHAAPSTADAHGQIAPGERSATLPPAEYGHALAPEQAAAGWISLFDGETTFGWTGARVEDGVLSGGTSTSRFPLGNLDLEAVVVRGGTLRLGEMEFSVEPGPLGVRLGPEAHVAITLGDGLAVQSLVLVPHDLEPILEDDLSGWERIDRSDLPEDARPAWRIEDGALRATGGPGALEFARPMGDFVLQARVRTLAPESNGGIFFRSQPGLFMQGYEAQIYNACEDNDPARPATYATGAIDDRQNARRLISRDGEAFTLTIIADGRHVATWVNGGQVTDWTDDREPHENPRQGLRLEPGTIQLQAHDAATDIVFERIAVGELGD